MNDQTYFTITLDSMVKRDKKDKRRRFEPY